MTIKFTKSKNRKLPYIKGTSVVAKGDTWITPGSKGKIISGSNEPGSVLVKWHEVAPEPDGKENTRRLPNVGRKLYHLSSALAYDDGVINPNLLFKMKYYG